MQDKSAVENAKEALKKAKKEYKEKKQIFISTSNAVVKSKRILKANTLIQADDTVKKSAEDVVTNKRTNLEKAKKELEEAKNALEDAKKALKDAKNLEKEGEKLLKEIEGKILNLVISQKLSEKLNRKEPTIKNALENSKAEILTDEQKNKLTTEQQKYLDSMVDGLSNDKKDLETQLESVQKKIDEKSKEISDKKDAELESDNKDAELKKLEEQELELKGKIKLCEQVEQLEKTINKEVDRNLDRIIRNTPEYKKIAGAKENLKKQLLNNKNKTYDETYIQKTNLALEAIELKFTSEGKVEWEFDKKKIKEGESKNKEVKEIRNRYEEIKDLAQDYVDSLNSELKEKGSTLAKLNKSLKEAVKNIKTNPEVQSFWEKIMEAIKSIFQGKFSEVGKDNVQKAVSRFTDELKKERENSQNAGLSKQL